MDGHMSRCNEWVCRFDDRWMNVLPSGWMDGLKDWRDE